MRSKYTPQTIDNFVRIRFLKFFNEISTAWPADLVTDPGKGFFHIIHEYALKITAILTL